MFPYKGMDDEEREIPRIPFNRFKTLPLHSTTPVEENHSSFMFKEDPASIMAWRLWAQRNDELQNAHLKDIPMFRRVLN